MSHERDSLERVATEKSTLISFLSNSLILDHTIPYLPVSSILNLSATSKSFHGLITHTPRVFRYLDLSCVKTAQFDIQPIDNGGEVWRNVQLDENLTEDDFYSGPLRGIFSNLQRRRILQNVQTLILDGLAAVTHELVHDILVDPSFNVRILSIRECKNLNERKLQKSLQYACRPTRPDPENTPRLKALYVFGSRDPVSIAAQEDKHNHNHNNNNRGAAGRHVRGHSHAAQQQQARSPSGPPGQVADGWYMRKGKMIARPIGEGWAETLQRCAGMISFDAPLCTGPRHTSSPAFGLNPYLKLSKHGMAVATIALRGCSGCGNAPEGLTYHSNRNGANLPVLAPVPAFSSAVKSAKQPHAHGPGSGEPAAAAGFVARCAECIRDRYCASCHDWWCESCYLDSKHTVMPEPVIVDAENDMGTVDYLDYLASLGPYPGTQPKELVTRSCWECGMNCSKCIQSTQLSCRSCCGGYCLIHNEGSTLAQCDWCSSRGSRVPLRRAAAVH